MKHERLPKLNVGSIPNIHVHSIGYAMESAIDKSYQLYYSQGYCTRVTLLESLHLCLNGIVFSNNHIKSHENTMAQTHDSEAQ